MNRTPGRFLLACLVLAGCDVPGEEAAPDAVVPAADAAPRCEGPAMVVMPVDVWGRPLAAAMVGGDAPPSVDGPAQWTVQVEAPDHQPAEVAVTWTGEHTAAALSADAPWTAISFAAGAQPCPTYTLFVGLEHHWFASGARPWQAGNAAELYTEPATLWAATSQALRAAQRSIFWITWWWQSDTDLLRSPDGADRTADTALGHLEAKPGLLRRVLVNQFLAGAVEGAVNLTVDAPLRMHGRDPNDGLEVLAETNIAEVPAVAEYAGPEPTVDFLQRLRARPEWAGQVFNDGPLRQALEPVFDVGSFHLKGTVIDGEVAFVQGENTQDDYWDTAEHAVFEPRRMPADADAEARAAVANRRRLPPFRPFQDYGIRLQGPVVGELDDLFALLWNHARGQRSAFFEDTTAWTLGPQPAPAGQLPIQIQATLPPPFTEQSILEGQRQAIRNARRYILVEDQYWRATRLLPDLVEALQAHPELVLIVVTNEIALSDGAKRWTYTMDQGIRMALGEAAADRYLLLQRRAFDLQLSTEAEDGEPAVHNIAVYNHAKLMLVDDVWLSVGSANKNNRSLLYDGELCAVVLDEAFTTAARRRILADWIGRVRADRLTDDMAANLALLRDTAAENDEILQVWRSRLPTLTDEDIEADRALRPFGTVFPYVPDAEYVLEVGPDLY